MSYSLSKLYIRLILIFALNACESVYSQIPSKEPEKWNCYFNEEFNGNITDNWIIANEFDHYGEPQVYTNRESNILIKHDTLDKNNYLVIRTKRENYICNTLDSSRCNKSKYEFTSGWIETKKDIFIKYGYIETRVKIPSGKGLWPAFWTFIRDSITNGHNAAEIDIFEMNGKHLKRQETNIHMVYKSDKKLPDYGKVLKVGNYVNDFHIYGLKWTPDEISWYFDNNLIRKVINPGIIDPVKLILNVAILPGTPVKVKTAFPTEFIVDYVRAYKEVK